MLRKVTEILVCACLVMVLAIGTRAFLFFGQLEGVILSLPDRVDARIAAFEGDINAKYDKTEKDIDSRIGQTLGIVNTTVLTSDRRTGEALDLVRNTSQTLLDPKTGLLAITNGQLTQLNTTVSGVAAPVGLLATNYANLPDQISKDRVFKAYIDNGLGLIAATKLTAGQTEKTMKVIADEAPKMAEHVDSVAVSVDTMAKDATREADALTGPKSKWAIFRTWLITIARVYGSI